MIGHTPGPWEVAPCSDSDEVVSIVKDYKDLGGGKSQARWIAECSAWIDFGDDAEAILSENDANARLIAAAPELLAALKSLIDGIDEYWMTENPGAVDAAQAAIDKAEGR